MKENASRTKGQRFPHVLLRLACWAALVVCLTSCGFWIWTTAGKGRFFFYSYISNMQMLDGSVISRRHGVHVGSSGFALLVGNLEVAGWNQERLNGETFRDDSLWHWEFHEGDYNILPWLKQERMFRLLKFPIGEIGGATPGFRRDLLLVGLPWWFLILFCLYPSYLALRPLIGLIRKKPKGICHTCGYDLRGSLGVCPECGSRKWKRS